MGVNAAACRMHAPDAGREFHYILLREERRRICSNPLRPVLRSWSNSTYILFMYFIYVVWVGYNNHCVNDYLVKQAKTGVSPPLLQ